MPTSKLSKGFTLIELLVVIAIIGVLSSIVMTAVGEGRERARVSHALSTIREIRKAVEIYNIDTGAYPTQDCMVDTDINVTCSAASDPFLVSLGVPGWSGPYITLWSLSHLWGGHVGYEHGGDVTDDGDGDGITDFFIFLDDDAAGTTNSNNSGAIPESALLKIDQALDDGNLSTGDVRGNGTGWVDQGVATGEISVKFDVE